jgi:hypothetical protein
MALKRTQRLSCACKGPPRNSLHWNLPPAILRIYPAPHFVQADLYFMFHWTETYRGCGVVEIRLWVETWETFTIAGGIFLHFFSKTKAFISQCHD